MKKYIALSMCCLGALPCFAQKGEIAGKVWQAVRHGELHTPAVSLSVLPSVRYPSLSVPQMRAYLSSSDALLEKALQVVAPSPLENMRLLGVRGPVEEVERLSRIKKVPIDSPFPYFQIERETVATPRYTLPRAAEALAGKENSFIIDRAAQNQQLQDLLAAHAAEIETEIGRAFKLSHHGAAAEWAFDNVFNRGAGIIGIGQDYGFYSHQGVRVIRSLLGYVQAFLPHRPIILITPFASGINPPAREDYFVAQGISKQAVNDVLEMTRTHDITVIGTAISSHADFSELNTVAYANSRPKYDSHFATTALGQAEQQHHLSRVIEQYRRDNPMALLIVWAPSNYVLYNGFNSVIAPLAQQGEVTSVLQLSSKSAPTRVEGLLPVSLQEKVNSLYGFSWQPGTNMPDLFGADVLLKVPGNISLEN